MKEVTYYSKLMSYVQQVLQSQLALVFFRMIEDDNVMIFFLLSVLSYGDMCKFASKLEQLVTF